MKLSSRWMWLGLALCLVIGTGGNALAEEAEFDAHASSYRYFFTDGDMDFHFGNLILGAAVNGGASTGEAFYAASRIKDGDALSWANQWYALAGRVLARGESSLAAGHPVSARAQFLRAAYYYRISVLALSPDDPGFLDRGMRCRELMRRAGALMSPKLEYFELPFEGTALPGYFRAARTDGGPAPTLLMIGGGETFIEDLYFYIADQAHARGWNFMTVDLPGQGLMPFFGQTFRTDSYVPLKLAVDYALSRPEVDPTRLAAYGISGGGLFAPQLAEHDPRVRAVAMNSAVVDAHALFATMPAALADAAEMKTWTPFHAAVVANICWRYGVDRPDKLVEANRGNTFAPAKVLVPALIIVGQGEIASAEVQRQQRLAMDGFPNPAKRMVVTPTDEGATNHCVMENRALVGQVLFDWLDEVLP